MFIGGELTHAINMAGMCGGGDWPIAGGLLDQSAWFLSLKHELDIEVARIQSEEMENS